MDDRPLPSLRSVVTAAGIAAPAALTVASLVRPAAVASAAPVILGLGLVAGGPHGALDHRVLRSLIGDPARSRVAVRCYAATGAAVTVALWLAPPPLLGVLLVVAVAHFAGGDTDWAALRDGRSPDRLDVAAGWVSGISAVVLPLATHSAAALGLLATVTGGSLPQPSTGLRAIVTTALLTAAPAVAVALHRAGRSVQALEVLVVTAVSSVAPPGAAIGVTFCFCHSARHIARLQDLGVVAPALRTLGGADRSRGRRRSGPAGLLGPLALTAAVGAAALLAGVPWLRVLVGGMLALTVPHALVVAASDRTSPLRFVSGAARR